MTTHPPQDAAPAESVAAAVDRLARAARTRTPCPPVRDLIGADDVAVAYAVQRALADARVAAGARRSGRKVGLTSTAVQAQVGVDQPDFGTLFADMELAHDAVVPSGALLQPRVEAEIAFVLGADLDGDLDTEQVRAAVDHQRAALEIVDSRIADWDITFGDTVADNGSSGLYVLGPTRSSLQELEPVKVDMTLSRHGEIVSRGSGVACLGDPLTALVWLARAGAEMGDPLRAGEVVLSGALGPMVAASVGDHFHADLAGLGQVAVHFAAEAHR